jgi:hypothetical protein
MHILFQGTPSTYIISLPHSMSKGHKGTFKKKYHKRWQ